MQMFSLFLPQMTFAKLVSYKLPQFLPRAVLYVLGADHCTMRKKLTYFFLPRRAADGKMDFLVLITKFVYLFTQGSPTWSHFLFRSYDRFFEFLAITP